MAMTAPNPVQLSKLEVLALTQDNVLAVKRPDCSMYNSCLTMALDGNWKGFGCTSCLAYQAITIDRRNQDKEGLEEILIAAANVENDGSAGRKRGVRPGADGKKRLMIVRDENEKVGEENSVA